MPKTSSEVFCYTTRMRLLKTNKNKFIAWLFLGLVGYLLGYFFVKRSMYDWPTSYQFSDDLLYNFYKLFVAEILLVPAIIIAIWALRISIKNKQFVWNYVHTIGLILLIFIAIYFALPILFPARGL